MKYFHCFIQISLLKIPFFYDTKRIFTLHNKEIHLYITTFITS